MSGQVVISKLTYNLISAHHHELFRYTKVITTKYERINTFLSRHVPLEIFYRILYNNVIYKYIIGLHAVFNLRQLRCYHFIIMFYI